MDNEYRRRRDRPRKPLSLSLFSIVPSLAVTGECWGGSGFSKNDEIQTFF